jgi:hypothetical protein
MKWSTALLATSSLFSAVAGSAYAFWLADQQNAQPLGISVGLMFVSYAVFTLAQWLKAQGH